MKIDIHTHAFSPSVAPRILSGLINQSSTVYTAQAFGDGTETDLLRQIDEAHFDAVAICPIATKPEHHIPILKTIQSRRDPRIIPAGSVHPDDPNASAHLAEQQANGARMVKLHPFFQNHDLNAPSMLRLFEACESIGLPVLAHTGDDPGFLGQQRSTPTMILDVVKRFPALKLICAHCAVWRHPETVDLLLGQPINVDIAFQYIDDQEEIITRFCREHPQDHLFFGSDWPWYNTGLMADWLHRLGLSPEREAAILGANAQRLLAL